MKYAVYILLALAALFLAYTVIHFIIATVITLAFRLLLIALVVGIVYALYKMMSRQKQRL